MNVKPEFRIFDVLVFWDHVAWICETINDDYCYVAQGPTPEKALERLKSGLHMTAAIQIQEGFKPFSDKLKPIEQDVKRWHRAKLLLVPWHLTPQKGKDYRLVISSTWGENVSVGAVNVKKR